MRQFDVCQLARGEVVVILQHDLLDELKTVVVAPLMEPARFPVASRLRPQTSWDREIRVIAVERLAAVERRALGPPLGSLEAHRAAIIAAIDILVTGI